MIGYAEMCRIAGVTHRQLQHWDERGYLVPAHAVVKGRSIRVYEPFHFRVAAILKVLVKGAYGSAKGKKLHAQYVRNLKVIQSMPELTKRWFAFSHRTGELILATDSALEMISLACQDAVRTKERQRGNHVIFIEVPK